MEHLGIFAFLAFTAISLFISAERERMRARSAADWVTDLASLAMHFFIVPALQIAVVYGLMNYFVPAWKGTVQSSWWLGLLLYVLLDYLWYWNHRILHAQTPLWNLHKTHHSPEQIDVLVTSRNALMTHLLMVYFWYIGVVTYVLNDPTWFLAFASVGVVVNFWGHTSFSLPCNSLLNRIITTAFITPREHHWHHSAANPHCNFGTVFWWWDRMHGTEHCEPDHPTKYGESQRRTVWNQLIWPF